MFSQVCVCPQSASWVFVHCSALLWLMLSCFCFLVRNGNNEKFSFRSVYVRVFHHCTFKIQLVSEAWLFMIWNSPGTVSIFMAESSLTDREWQDNHEPVPTIIGQEKTSTIGDPINYMYLGQLLQCVLKPYSHITYAFAFASDFKNGFYGNSMVTAFTFNVYIFKNKIAKIKEKCKRRR